VVQAEDGAEKLNRPACQVCRVTFLALWHVLGGE
jgi:hypothetical protein